MAAASINRRDQQVLALTISQMDGNFQSLADGINGVADKVDGSYQLLSVNCPTPTTSLQIVNKGYVDNQINKYIGIAAAMGN
jgi:hypothetical protein